MFRPRQRSRAMSDSTALNPLPSAYPTVPPDFDESLLEPLGRIERQLEREMPRLRELYPNMWIAYGATGLLLPPNESMEELLRQCEERGFSIDECILETTAPPPPSIITDVVL